MPPEKLDHVWPLPGEHMFTKWQQKTPMPHAIQYRVCIHPDCSYIEEREAPKG